MVAAVTEGLANVTAAITASSGGGVDLSALTAEITRVADALYVTGPTLEAPKSITQVATDANEQVSSVIGTYSDGERVKVYNETP